MPTRVVIILAVCALGALAVSGAGAHRLPQAPRCPILPASNPFNQRVDSLPVAANSATLVDSIGADATAKADFGSGTYDGGPIGIPYKVVKGSQKRVPVTFDYADESDGSRYPLPANVADRGRRERRRRPPRARRRQGPLPAVRALRRPPARRRRTLARRLGRDLRPAVQQAAPRRLDVRRRRRPADPPRPGALRRGREGLDRPRDPLHRAPHAQRLHPPGAPLRIERQRPGAAADGPRIGSSAAPTSATSGRRRRSSRTALQRYGALLADNGSPWFFSGAPDSRWDNDDLQTLRNLHGLGLRGRRHAPLTS